MRCGTNVDHDLTRGTTTLAYSHADLVRHRVRIFLRYSSSFLVWYVLLFYLLLFLRRRARARGTDTTISGEQRFTPREIMPDFIYTRDGPVDSGAERRVRPLLTNHTTA